jgi:hypothetical protein
MSVSHAADSITLCSQCQSTQFECLCFWYHSAHSSNVPSVLCVELSVLFVCLFIYLFADLFCGLFNNLVCTKIFTSCNNNLEGIQKDVVLA